MNEKALRVLEYNKIIGRLAEFAGSGQAKERCPAAGLRTYAPPCGRPATRRFAFQKRDTFLSRESAISGAP